MITILSDRQPSEKEIYEVLKEEEDDQNPIDDLQGKMTFEDFSSILPLQIQNFTIRQVSWDDFTGTNDSNSQWKAHTFWVIGYSYDIKMRKMKKSNSIRYRLVVSSWAALTEKCWVRIKWQRLLEHETGHYLIGCACALEFKKRADKQKFTQNYRIEAQKLFTQIFNEYLQLELLYDKETDHSRDVLAQKRWNSNLISQLKDYQVFFGGVNNVKK